MANIFKLGESVKYSGKKIKRYKDKTFIVIGRRSGPKLSNGKSDTIWILKLILDGKSIELMGVDLMPTHCIKCGEELSTELEGLCFGCDYPR